jgi:hypothetical protein
MFGLGFLEGLFGGASQLADGYGRLDRNFGGSGFDTSGLSKGLNIIGDLSRLLEVSRSFAKFLGADQLLQPRSVFTAAAENPQITLNPHLQAFRSGNLSAVGAYNTSLTPRLRGGDGPVVSVQISKNQSDAMSSYQERGAGTVRTYGPNGGSYESVGKYFADNPNTLFG